MEYSNDYQETRYGNGTDTKLIQNESIHERFVSNHADLVQFSFLHEAQTRQNYFTPTVVEHGETELQR